MSVAYWAEEPEGTTNMASLPERTGVLEHQVKDLIEAQERLEKKVDLLIDMLNQIKGAKTMLIIIGMILTVFGLAGVAKVVEFFKS